MSRRAASPALRTRPAGKLVTSSTNGMSSGKGANGRRGETRRGVRVCVLEGRASGGGGGHGNLLSSLAGQKKLSAP